MGAEDVSQQSYSQPNLVPYNWRTSEISDPQMPGTLEEHLARYICKPSQITFLRRRHTAWRITILNDNTISALLAPFGGEDSSWKSDHLVRTAWGRFSAYYSIIYCFLTHNAYFERTPTRLKRIVLYQITRKTSLVVFARITFSMPSILVRLFKWPCELIVKMIRNKGWWQSPVRDAQLILLLTDTAFPLFAKRAKKRDSSWKSSNLSSKCALEVSFTPVITAEAGFQSLCVFWMFIYLFNYLFFVYLLLHMKCAIEIKQTKDNTVMIKWDCLV